MKSSFLRLPFFLFFIISLSLFAPLQIISQSSQATIVLSPATGSYNVGDIFDIAVLVDTGGREAIGGDIYLNFTSGVLSLVNIEEGTIFGQYIGGTINNEEGSATISAISGDLPLFTGTGTFITLRFQALAEGTGTVSFDFTPGNTNDTNITELVSESDILDSVTNASYTIGPGTGKGGVGVGTPTSTVPVTAGPFSRNLIVILSSGLIGIGILGYIIYKRSILRQ